MLRQVILAAVVGFGTALAVVLIGYILIEVGVDGVGNFLRTVAWFVGLLAAAWYYFSNRTSTDR